MMTNSSSSPFLVVPGQLISADVGYLRGHGCYDRDGKLYSSVLGTVERVNKLITVKPLQSRYTGETGDIVVGRIVEVHHQLWTVDIHGSRDAILQLSAINFGGNELRRLKTSDEYKMRNYFFEGDVICAEVHSAQQSGFVSLKTRGFKFGKLRNGIFMQVPSPLIKRVKSHIFSFPFEVDIVLGLNGMIWISKSYIFGNDSSENSTAKDIDVPLQIRERISRVRNCIVALATIFAPIYPESIMAVYDWSLRQSIIAKDLLRPEIIESLALSLRE